jgi:hypothetical protein
MEDKQNVISKLVKLLKLAERAGTPGEAAAAAAQAQRMMEKYRISVADMDGAETVASEPISGKHVLFSVKSRMPSWLSLLSHVVAVNNSCETYIHYQWSWYPSSAHPQRRKRRTASAVRLVGKASDIQIASHLFVYLRREIERLTDLALARGTVYGRTGAAQFRIGAIESVAVKLEEARRDARVGASSTAIVRVDQDLADVRSWMNDNLKLERTAVVRLTRDQEAREAGRAAGDSIALKPAVPGEAGPNLLE